MKFTRLPVGHFDPAEQERIYALQRASEAFCETCRKRFTKSTRHLTAGQIALTHLCGTGHDVHPVREGKETANG